jgi:hypothetical protein
VVSADDPRVELLRELKRRGYEFATVTPATHEIVLSRHRTGPPSLRDIFGWNRPFSEDELDHSLSGLLRGADLLVGRGRMRRTRLRLASLGQDLFLHSGFPTDDQQAVFFGPDTYRFVRFVLQHLPARSSEARIVDMGAGCGVGGIAVKRAMPSAAVTLVDRNEAALELASVNAAAAGVEIETTLSAAVPRGADLVIANPPFMMDARGRAYRDGGDLLGGRVALEWAQQAIAQLNGGGTMLLYTGVAFSGGVAPLVDALHQTCSAGGVSLVLEEIDPDIFGEELTQPAYGAVERIAAYGAVLRVGSG